MPFGRWGHCLTSLKVWQVQRRSMGGVRTGFGEGGGQLDRGRARGVLNPVRENQTREPEGY
ncbi:unnamed protein product [Ascophyllum nodosum]